MGSVAIMPALQIGISGRGEVTCSKAALTESKAARSTFMKTILEVGTAEFGGYGGGTSLVAAGEVDFGRVMLGQGEDCGCADAGNSWVVL